MKKKWVAFLLIKKIFCILIIYVKNYQFYNLKYRTDDFYYMLLMVWNQANHRFTTKMQRRIYGQATNAAIRPLNEEKAVQAAADLLGELFIFTVLILSSSYLWSEIVTKYSLVYVTRDASAYHLCMHRCPCLVLISDLN